MVQKDEADLTRFISYDTEVLYFTKSSDATVIFNWKENMFTVSHSGVEGIIAL